MAKFGAYDRAEDYRMPFGKHRDRAMRDILGDDPTYLDWLAGLDDLNPTLKRVVEHMTTMYSAEIQAAIDSGRRQP